MDNKCRYLLALLIVFNGYHTNGFRITRRGKPFFYQDEYGRKMEVRRSGIPIMKRECDCYCLVAGNDESIHCCIQCHVTESVCFPGSAHVTLNNGDVIKMKDVKPGHEVLTASEDGKIETTQVLGFLTFDPEVIGRYHRLTLDSDESLLLSRSHLVFAAPRNISDLAEPMFAANVKIGFYLLVKTGKIVTPKKVVAISIESHKGAYVPLTSSGTLLVDNIKASSYAAFPHHLSHAFMAPLRWLPSLLTTAVEPTSGDHPYVTFLKAFGDLVTPSSRFGASSQQQAQNDTVLCSGSDVIVGKQPHVTTRAEVLSRSESVVGLSASVVAAT